ncbi:hypothetical protein O3P69_004564 [Scylla paramamosain]|uniref:Uncharacterized protein n=1 Tax=Scylla paramamosain TaxID=85552 RepID=A0AAW0UCQ7_SCYPA
MFVFVSGWRTAAHRKLGVPSCRARRYRASCVPVCLGEEYSMYQRLLGSTDMDATHGSLSPANSGCIVIFAASPGVGLDMSPQVSPRVSLEITVIPKPRRKWGGVWQRSLVGLVRRAGAWESIVGDSGIIGVAVGGWKVQVEEAEVEGGSCNVRYSLQDFKGASFKSRPAPVTCCQSSPAWPALVRQLPLTADVRRPAGAAYPRPARKHGSPASCKTARNYEADKYTWK